MLHLALLANASNYHLRRWLPALTARDIRISLLSFAAPDLAIENIDFIPLNRPTSSLLRHSIADFVVGAGRIRDQLRRLSPDVLMGSYATNYGYLAARTGFHPFVLQTWTADVQLYPSQGLKRFVLGPMVRHALRAADGVTTDGPALQAEVARRFPFAADKTESILWGIELDEYLHLKRATSDARRRLGLPEDARVITHARGLRIHDRPEISLPAILEILEDSDRYHALVLTLGHEPPARVAGALQELRDHPRCVVVDRFLSKAEVRDVWSASDVVVSVPLFDGISESLLEAMAAGCIPVLSDIPPNRIIVPDSENAIFSRADTSSTLARDLRHGLSHLDQLIDRAIPANREWVKKNASIDQAAGKLADLLVEVAGKKING